MKNARSGVPPVPVRSRRPAKTAWLLVTIRHSITPIGSALGEAIVLTRAAGPPVAGTEVDPPAGLVLSRRKSPDLIQAKQLATAYHCCDRSRSGSVGASGIDPVLPRQRYERSVRDHEIISEACGARVRNCGHEHLLGCKHDGSCAARAYQDRERGSRCSVVRQSPTYARTEPCSTDRRRQPELPAVRAA